MIYAYLRVSTDMQDCDNQKQGVINWLKYKKKGKENDIYEIR